MRRLLFWCVAVIGAVALSGCGRWLATEPLHDGGTDRAEAPSMPTDTMVLNVTNAAVSAPFAIGLDITSPLGAALSLPDGAGSPKQTGTAVFNFTTVTQQSVVIWVHARWNNSCGNSVSVKIDDGCLIMVGQDAVYGTWHWVKGNCETLTAGAHTLTLAEREDGIAIDQVLLTPDPDFVPTGCILAGKTSLGIRRFADAFDRSPGHGLGAWEIVSGQWDIAFSLDPNRVPHQYALTGAPKFGDADTPALILVQGQPWQGVSASFSVLAPTNGTFGVVLAQGSDDTGESSMRLAFTADGVTNHFTLSAPDGRHIVVALDDRLRTNQWHRIDVESWAWLLRVTLDGKPVLTATDLPVAAGAVGMFVADGTAIFDDVAVEDIPWQAENGRDRRMSWIVDDEAAWLRVTDEVSELALIGKRGTIRSAAIGLPIAEVLMDGPPLAPPAGFKATGGDASATVFTPVDGHGDAAPATIALESGTEGDMRLHRLAIRYGEPGTDTFQVGTYHFTRTVAQDPADYLDFTDEEYAEIAKSPESDKLKRGNKFRLLLGSDDTCFWLRRSGTWMLKDGALRGSGAGAVVKHWRDVIGDLDISLDILAATSNTVLQIVLYAEPAAGAVVQVAAAAGPSSSLVAPADGHRHSVDIRARGGHVAARIDRGDWHDVATVSTVSGGILLRLESGTAEFDNIDVRALRATPRSHYYAFDRRETDWWREGGAWMDHGGIACVLSSNWISLIAPHGAGTLWNKRRFGSDIVLALNIEESSDWYGWHKRPTHVHYAYDNVQLRLAESSSATDGGYLLEVNARKHTATVLYRNGVEVAMTPQNSSFPIRYTGGHAKFTPRRNRITLAKQGDTLQAIINGRIVLSYTDPQPLAVTRAGFGGHDTRVNFSAVELVEPGVGALE